MPSMTKLVKLLGFTTPFIYAAATYGLRALWEEHLMDAGFSDMIDWNNRLRYVAARMVLIPSQPNRRSCLFNQEAPVQSRSFPSALRLALFLFAISAFGLAAPPAGAAQIAASIEFDPAPRPSGLPDDMQPQPGASLQFLAIKTIDGVRLDAALWQPDNVQPGRATMIVQAHGSGGNLAELPLRAVARALSAKGYAALTISTRGHDENLNTDNFLDARKDIEAAVATAKALGYTSIVLQGHSLGTIQMEYYAATNWDPAIRALVLTGPFAKLPWKSRNILMQNEDVYKKLGLAARDALAGGKAGDTLPLRMPYLGGRQTPVTAQHFLTYRDEQTSAADGTYWIPRISKPILLLRDQADGIVLPFEPHMLLSAARAEGSLAQNITYVAVPDPHPPSAAGHSFTNNTQPLIDAVSAWLAEQHL
jgi:pimeloyl-ACP methyl ester carboxylesterase